MLVVVMQIKNVIFDIGNVLVRWAPEEVIKSIFPDADPAHFVKQMRSLWIDLNLGKLTEAEALFAFQNQLGISEQEVLTLMLRLKTSQTPIAGSLELLKKLYIAKVPLYSITDNVREIIDYHKLNSEFLQYFRGVVVSADVGVLKPDQKIYRHLLDTYNLVPQESVFIDDVQINVDGALAVGMHSFQFKDSKDCLIKLIEMGVEF